MMESEDIVEKAARVRTRVRLEKVGVVVRGKPLMRGIRATFEPSELVAVFGPEILVRVLAGRTAHTGTISANGRALDRPRLQRLVSFAVGDLSTMLTVKQHLYYAAATRCPARWPALRKFSAADGLMAALQLADERLCDASPETRRLASCATQMLSRRPVVLLDGPTRGLDAVATTRLVRALRRCGKTVVCTLEQPTWAALSVFDKLLCVSGGSQVYGGRVSKLPDFLRAAGAPCPPHENPADHLCHVLSWGAGFWAEQWCKVAPAATKPPPRAAPPEEEEEEEEEVEKDQAADAREQLRLLVMRACHLWVLDGARTVVEIGIACLTFDIWSLVTATTTRHWLMVVALASIRVDGKDGDDDGEAFFYLRWGAMVCVTALDAAFRLVAFVLVFPYLDVSLSRWCALTFLVGFDCALAARIAGAVSPRNKGLCVVAALSAAVLFADALLLSSSIRTLLVLGVVLAAFLGVAGKMMPSSSRPSDDSSSEVEDDEWCAEDHHQSCSYGALTPSPPSVDLRWKQSVIEAQSATAITGLGGVGRELVADAVASDKTLRRMVTMTVFLFEADSSRLTAREMLRLAAALAAGWDLERRRQLEEKGLRLAAAVGLFRLDARHLTLSERKRALVCRDLACSTRPIAVFPDLTSCMDARSALETTRAVVRETRIDGRSAICALQQHPSWQLASAFTKLVVLGETGVVYAGDPSGLAPFLAASGKPCGLDDDPLAACHRLLEQRADFPTTKTKTTAAAPAMLKDDRSHAVLAQYGILLRAAIAAQYEVSPLAATVALVAVAEAWRDVGLFAATVWALCCVAPLGARFDLLDADNGAYSLPAAWAARATASLLLAATFSGAWIALGCALLDLRDLALVALVSLVGGCLATAATFLALLGPLPPSLLVLLLVPPTNFAPNPVAAALAACYDDTRPRAPPLIAAAAWTACIFMAGCVLAHRRTFAYRACDKK